MKKTLLGLVLILLAIFSFGQSLEVPYDETPNIYEYTGFILSYSEEHEQAEWVAYELTAEEAQGDYPRTNNFRQDPRIETGTATLDDYRGSGYDRGHLAPAGDMAWSLEAMSDSFYFSNMSPQSPSFNRVSWRMLESLVRDWAIKYGSVYIITGPILEGGLETIGPDEVAVPRWFFKAVLRFDGEEGEAIAFIVPNERFDFDDLKYYAFSIDFAERFVGVDMFYNLDNSIEDNIEREYDLGEW